MHVAVTGKHINVGDALRGHVEKSLGDSVSKYFDKATEDDEEEQPAEGDRPAVIAEITIPVDTLAVGGVAMRMDLGNPEALVFHNRAHDGINVAFGRGDGHIGWIDPQGNPPGKTQS